MTLGEKSRTSLTSPMTHRDCITNLPFLRSATVAFVALSLGCSDPSGDSPAHSHPDAATDTAVTDTAVTDTAVTPDTSPNTDVGQTTVTDFVATLEGRQEVPTVYDSTSTGRFTLHANQDSTRADWTLSHTISHPTGASLRFAWPGQVGTPALELQSFTDGSRGTITLTPALSTALQSGRLTVEIRSRNYSGGELRGQLVRPDEQIFIATLSGDQIVSTVGTTLIAGSAVFFVDSTTLAARYAIDLGAFAPTIVDLHLGSAFSVGPSVVSLPLGQPQGTVQLTPAAHQALSLGRLYLDAHSHGYPDGATRGQLLGPGDQLYATPLTGQGFSQPRATRATGFASIIVSADRHTLTLDGGWTTLTPTHASLDESRDDTDGAPIEALSLTANRLALGPLTPSRTTVLFEALSQGHLFVTLASDTFPTGEIRGRLRHRPAD